MPTGQKEAWPDTKYCMRAGTCSAVKDAVLFQVLSQQEGRWMHLTGNLSFHQEKLIQGEVSSRL